VWHGQWRAGGRKVKRQIGPKRERGTSDGLSRAQAERELRRLIETEVVARAPAISLTIREVGDRYVDHLEQVMDRKATTIKDYRGYVRGHFEPYFRDRPISGIDETQVSAYLKHKRGSGLAVKTVNNHLNFMHGLFRFAVKRGWAKANPVTDVDRPRQPRRASTRLRFLQPEELESVIAAIPQDDLGAVEAPLYLTAAMTGMRQGELIALAWIDIDWTARRVRVADNFPRGAVEEPDTPKSREGRSVPMADRVAQALKRHRERSHYTGETDLVFCHPFTGGPFDPSKLRKRFSEALSRARVREVTFHELRHTFGTQLAAAGVPLRTIQEWMGHADAKTTEVYRHYSPDSTHGADLIEGAFGRETLSRLE